MPVVSPWTAGFGRLHALTIDDRHRQTGLAPDALAVGDDRHVVDLFDLAGVVKDRKPVENRASWRKLARQKAPGDTAAQDVEDRVHNLAQAPLLRGPRTGEPGRYGAKIADSVSVKSFSYCRCLRLCNRRAPRGSPVSARSDLATSGITTIPVVTQSFLGWVLRRGIASGMPHSASRRALFG